MHQITVNISDAARQELKSFLFMKRLTDSTTGGLGDEFLRKVLKAVMDGETKVDIKLKTETKKK